MSNSQTSEEIRKRVDGAMLLGFANNGTTFATIVNSSIASQEVYNYLAPISEHRSIDQPEGENYYIVSFTPSKQCDDRIEDWTEEDRAVPHDVNIEPDALALMAKINGSTRETEDGEVLEMHFPPMESDSRGTVVQKILTTHGMVVDGGLGREPIRFDEEDSEMIEQYIEESSLTG